MTLQNRVTPWGEIIATPERGLLMGNRGCLHDGQRRVLKDWARMPWVTCRLAFNGRHRQVMAPGSYTELFFLDEATALAAGHRPCATCRRDAYTAFKDHWLAANPELASRIDGSIQSIDRFLHAERVDGNRHKRTWEATLGGLPDGCMVTLEAADRALLVLEGRLYPWSPGGYGAPQAGDPQTSVRVLTPRSVVRVLARGYRPELHPSVSAPVAVSATRPVTTSAAPRPSATTKAPAVTQAPTPAPVSAPAQRTTPPPGARPVQGTTSAAKPPPSSPATAATSNTLYRLSETPRGRELYTYFAAILSVTGMDQGAVYPLKKFLGNFRGHEKEGRIEKAPGGYRLTRAGQDYFAGRYRPGNDQQVYPAEVEAMARLIRSGGAAGWEPVD